MSALSPTMSVEQFDNGYFYAADLKAFAREIGIAVGNRRKIELERLIREFLLTGRVPVSKPVLPRKPGQPRDVLDPDSPVTNYVGDKKTKSFLLDLVHSQEPELRDKSGQWYWLNDWWRGKQESGARFTYGDLAAHLRKLMQTPGRLPQIPSARLNNFVSDFRADPRSPAVPRAVVLQEWQWLKAQPGSNTYVEYRRLRPHNVE